jgi:hypothetical protein
LRVPAFPQQSGIANDSRIFHSELAAQTPAMMMV